MKIQILTLTLIVATILGACSKEDDYQAQLDELRRLNVELQTKITQVDQKVEPKDQTQLKREEAETVISDLRNVIGKMQKQIAVMSRNQRNQSTTLVSLDEALAAILELALSTEDGLRKTEGTVQDIIVMMQDLVTSQQLAVEIETITKRQDATDASVADLRAAIYFELDFLEGALSAQDDALRAELQALRTRVAAAETREAVRAVREALRPIIERARVLMNRRIAEATAAVNVVLSGMQGLLRRVFTILPWDGGLPPMLPPAAP